MSDIDPLAGAAEAAAPEGESGGGAEIEVTRSASLDRLYRPQALDLPVLVARDAPIATLNPRETGAFAGVEPVSESPLRPDMRVAAFDAPAEPPADADPAAPGPNVPKVVEDLGPTIRMVATEETWVRVRSAEGNTLYEQIMQAGEYYDIPAMEVPPTLRTGNSGAVYFAMGTDCYGPVGARGEVTSNVPLERVALADRYDAVLPEDADNGLNRMFADLSPELLPKLPCQAN